MEHLQQTKLRALIIDDEPDACRNLDILLRKYCSDVMGQISQTTSTLEAERLLKEIDPHIVFIDIEMPAENAFQFLERIGTRNHFYTIFVTAYDEYAIRAIKINALDYILKPVCEEELTTAVGRVWELVRAAPAGTKSPELHLPSVDKEQERIVLRSHGDRVLLDFSNIIYIQAEGSYSRFFYYEHGAVKKFLTSYTLQYYQELLSDTAFFRCHKSYLIHLKHLSGILAPGSLEITMDDGSVLPLSRRRYALLNSLIQKNT